MAARDDIHHIVVLMLENRSFDHMLGHLSLPPGQGGAGRDDVDGLRGETQDYNEHDGERHRLHRLRDTAAVDLDPPHHHDRVRGQIAPSDGHTATMGGFVSEYAAEIRAQDDPSAFPKAEAGLMMGYYGEWETWALSRLAQAFTVCDRWFSPLAGPTQPNRMYALAGDANGGTDNQASGFTPDFWDVTPVFDYLPGSVEARSYSHDIAFLRMIEGKLVGTECVDKVTHLFERARGGDLPAVSWIDPNFNMGITEPLEETAELQTWFENHYDSLFGEREADTGFDLDTDNSDHPDADIARGQELIARVYNHLLKADPSLERTLFIVTYDEHGGFYDHVAPPGWEGTDSDEDSYLQNPAFHPVGVRVPAVAVSGRLKPGSVCSTPMDHCVLVRTILERFAPDRLEAAPERVRRSVSLWHELPWTQTPHGEVHSLRKARRKRRNELRDDMGSLAAAALQKGGNYGHL